MLVALTKEGKRYLIKGKELHTQYGYVKNPKKGLNKTHLGKEIYVFKPGFVDLLWKIKRGPAIITPKDIGYIIAETGIGKNSVALDAGTGSAYLAAYLANICKKVYSYEIRKDHYKLAKENIKFLGLKNVVIKNRDLFKGIKEKNLDLIVFDLPEPWTGLEQACKALKVGGFLVCYLPNLNQVTKTISRLPKHLIHVKTTELIEREWIIDKQHLRPKAKSLMHTAFLVFFRKVY